MKPVAATAPQLEPPEPRTTHLATSPLVRRVRAFLADWLVQIALPRPGVRLVAACSGGPDSTALLLALWALRAELQLSIHVVCVDHGLRPQAQTEAQSVCAVATRLGLSAATVAVHCPPGPSLLATARAARYEALAQVAVRQQANAVLVAHTQQDQAETMLMRWLAGAGLRGLCGMESQRDLAAAPSARFPVALLRPLLTTTRAEVDDLLAQEAALVAPLPVHDPSNVDRHYQRSRLRHDILPLLRSEQPQLDTHLAQLAAQLRDDSDYLEQQADAAYRALAAAAAAGVGADKPVSLPVGPITDLPPALFARVMMRASGGGLGQTHIAALRTLCAHQNGTRSLDLPGGRRAERRYAELWFFAPPAVPHPPPDAAPAQTLMDCGLYTLPQGTLCLQWQPAQDHLPENTALKGGLPPVSPGEARLLLPAPVFPLTVRPPRPGDRMRLPSGQGHRKISDILIDLKVPRSERQQVRLLCQGDHILWIVGYRQVASRFGDEAGPRAVLLARFLAKPLP